MRGDLARLRAAAGPCLGKTTLANIIANEMGAHCVTSGPVLDKPGDLAGLLHEPQPGGRALHRRDPPLSPIVEEYLYSAMEDSKIDIVLDYGPLSAFGSRSSWRPSRSSEPRTRSGLLTPRCGRGSGSSARILRRRGLWVSARRDSRSTTCGRGGGVAHGARRVSPTPCGARDSAMVKGEGISTPADHAGGPPRR